MSISGVAPRADIINVVFDERLGGPQRRIVAVSRELEHSGINTILLKPPGGPETESFASSNGVRTKAMEMQKPSGLLSPAGLLRYGFGALRDVQRFSAVFQSMNADVVHVNGAFFLAPSIAARLAGLKLVWHLNDTMLPRPIARFLGKVVQVLSSEVVAAAEAVAEYYGVPKASVIHAPVDTKVFVPKAERANRSTATIGILGNWAVIKGYDRYVQVLQAVSEASARSIDGLAIGGYPESQLAYRAEVLESAERLGVAWLIDDRGFVANPSRLIREMDVLVLTSRSEASPTCVLEAMASGVPVVAFDVGGVREMLGVGRTGTRGICGVVVKEGDVAHMSAEIVALFEDSDRFDKYSSAGVERASSLYSVEACAKRHKAVYERAVGDTK